MKNKDLGIIIGAIALKIVRDALLIPVTTVALALTFPESVALSVGSVIDSVEEMFGYEPEYEPEYDDVWDVYGPAPGTDISGWE